MVTEYVVVKEVEVEVIQYIRNPLSLEPTIAGTLVQKSLVVKVQVQPKMHRWGTGPHPCWWPSSSFHCSRWWEKYGRPTHGNLIAFAEWFDLCSYKTALTCGLPRLQQTYTYRTVKQKSMEISAKLTLPLQKEQPGHWWYSFRCWTFSSLKRTHLWEATLGKNAQVSDSRKWLATDNSVTEADILTRSLGALRTPGGPLVILTSSFTPLQALRSRMAYLQIQNLPSRNRTGEKKYLNVWERMAWHIFVDFPHINFWYPRSRSVSMQVTISRLLKRSVTLKLIAT